MIDLSFIIPFYKGDLFIEHAVKSIISSHSSQKSTTDLPKIEILVLIDSMESDEMYIQQKLESINNNYCKLQVIKNIENLGVATTRNKGLELAQGTNILCLDQDDFLSVDFFEFITIENLKNHNFILTNGRLFFEGKKSNVLIYYTKPKIDLKHLCKYDIIRSPGQVIASKKLFKEHQFAVSKNSFGSDDKFCWIRMFNQFSPNVLYIDKPLYLANLHKQNFSIDSKQLVKCVIELWQNLLQNENPSTATKKFAKENLILCNKLLKKVNSIQANWQYFLYYTQPNKLISFFIKKIRLTFNF